MHKVYNKIIISGNVLEYFEYGEPYYKDYAIREDWNKQKIRKEKEKDVKRSEYSLKRSKNRIRRLINSNFDIFDKFITLTFADNEKNLDYCNYEFKKFIQRLKYIYTDLEYIVVVEFQERGAVHYHMLCNLGYVRNKTLQNIWKNGFVKINRIDRVDNIGAYVVKYLQKDLNDNRLKGRKCYFKSKGLKEPIIYTQKKEVDALASSLLQDLQPVYENQFNSEYTGLTKYKQFNLLKSRELEPVGTNSV
jgi:hypothetical protein